MAKKPRTTGRTIRKPNLDQPLTDTPRIQPRGTGVERTGPAQATR